LKSVGIIANPASGKDIRRLVAFGSVFDNNEKVNIVKRLLLAMDSLGVEEVIAMPDDFRIGPRAADDLEVDLAIRYLDIMVTRTQDDSVQAARMMAEMDVACIITLGGDGTNRAVAKACGDVRCCRSLRGRTTSSFHGGGYPGGHCRRRHRPQFARARAGRGRAPVSRSIAATNSSISPSWISSFPGRVSSVPARSGRIHHLRAFPHRAGARANRFLIRGGVPASPAAGLRRGVAHCHRRGIAAGHGADRAGVDLFASHRLPHTFTSDEAVPIARTPSMIALDGEREISVRSGDTLTVRLNCEGPWVVDIEGVLQEACRRGLFLSHQRVG